MTGISTVVENKRWTVTSLFPKRFECHVGISHHTTARTVVGGVPNRRDFDSKKRLKSRFDVVCLPKFPISYCTCYTQSALRRKFIGSLVGPTIGRSISSSQNHADAVLSDGQKSLVTPNMRSPERIFKVILIGDTGVGKSSFMHQFCDGVFYPRLRATVGVDFRTRTLRVDNSAYSIQLWDTAGQEKYRSIVRTYFRKVDGVIIIYDVTMPDSFGNIRSWMEQISENSSDSKIPQVVVGNKIDLKNRPDVDVSTIVPTETGRKFAESLGAMFIETSACTAENVDEAVRMLAREMKLEEDTKIATVNVAATPTRKKSQTCCS